ncbi:hypothetical protein [Antrihabitans spumae]|jgi:hypothetical protein|uniref:Uncharacterized protein n=1 Tax=Antrihabitans spumae TaxID=3373370 RepID=A0ABW7JKM1_9NOCA
MKFSLRTFAAIAGLLLFFLSASATASAAPTDVSGTASVSGNTVTSVISNNSGGQITCGIAGFPAGTVDPNMSRPTFGLTYTDVPASGTAPVVFENVPNGTYDIHWKCVNVGFTEGWATFNAQDTTKTAEPATVTVPNNQICIFGSACI